MSTLTQKQPSASTPSSGASRDLERLFSPRTIGVVGASRTPGSVGHAILRNLIWGGFTGAVYPVNPKTRSIMAVRCWPTVTAVDDTLDLVVVIVPANAVESVLIEAAQKGTRHFIVISAGFKELGGEGVEREARLGALAKERGLSILGPNCLGLINTDPAVCLNAAFGGPMPKVGPLGLISQSGALAASLLDYARGRHVGFSRFISFGNKADLTEIDLLNSLGNDPKTKAILMYIEDLTDGRAFVDAAYRITRGPDPKPIIAIKTGRTTQGASAAASHTGSLAGSDEVYEAIMSQAGVIRADSVEELFDYAEIFSNPTLPPGRRTAIVTNAGGPGIMATDACIRSGLTLAQFQDYTIKSLRFQMPAAASLKNPVDVIGDARHDRYRMALDAVVADEGVDQVFVLVTPQAMTDSVNIASVIGDFKTFSSKPIAACMMGLVDVSSAIDVLHNQGVPTFAFPENAMRALAAKSRYAEWVSTAESEYKRYDVDDDAVDRILRQEVQAGRSELMELRSLEILSAYGFPIVPHQLAATRDEAVAAAQRIGYPVVLKIVGPKILHKTDVGGVRLNLKDADSVAAAFDTMIEGVRSKLGKDIEIWGVLVQAMLPPGRETILGMARDARFGPLIMFGLGGIYTEVFKDVSFRLAPIRENTAPGMIAAIRSHKLLEGVRGESPADTPAITDALLRLSQLVTHHPQIKELDINPLLVYPRGSGAVVADARIILNPDSVRGGSAS